MGHSHSKVAKDLEGVNPEERFFGLENYGNTCYCNSVLQALYFCKPFRRRLIDYVASVDDDSVQASLLFALAELFTEVRGSCELCCQSAGELASMSCCQHNLPLGCAILAQPQVLGACQRKHLYLREKTSGHAPPSHWSQ